MDTPGIFYSKIERSRSFDFTKKRVQLKETDEYKTLRRNCYICDKYNEMTELHHLIPREVCDEYLRQYDVILKVPKVYLCPNCHSIWHLITDKRVFERGISLLETLNDNERTQLNELENIYSDWFGKLYHQLSDICDSDL